MKHKILTILLLIPIAIFAQGKEVFDDEFIDTSIPLINQYAKDFKVDQIYFNRQIDGSGVGEILEVEILLKNLTDNPMKIYLFTVATYEIDPSQFDKSFKMPVPPEIRMKSFVASPDQIENFRYVLKTKDGKPALDPRGKQKYKLVKFPMDPKKGHVLDLVKQAHIKTYHLSKYRTDYYFFNNVALIIFNEKGEPLFRQKYLVKGFRR